MYIKVCLCFSDMNTAICVCVLLVALSTGSCLVLPIQTQDEDQSVAEHTRHTRAAPLGGQFGLLSNTKNEGEEDPRSSLSELLARIISAKGRNFLYK